MNAAELNEYNREVIAEFRANAGKVGGPDGIPVLLLHTVGARSGQERINPLSYLRDGERVFVFAANQGAERHPAWFHNLLADPEVTAEIGTETIQVTAVQLVGPERDRVFAKQVSLLPIVQDYADLTDRVIPVVELVPQRPRAH